MGPSKRVTLKHMHFKFLAFMLGGFKWVKFFSTNQVLFEAFSGLDV